MNKYLITGLLLLAAGLLVGCRKTEPPEMNPPKAEILKPVVSEPVVSEPAASESVPDTSDGVGQHGQLIACTETREEAQMLADLYGIRLVSWGFGVAEFYTEEDPREVIRRGQENGWRELSMNDTQYLMETQ